MSSRCCHVEFQLLQGKLVVVFVISVQQAAALRIEDEKQSVEQPHAILLHPLYRHPQTERRAPLPVSARKPSARIFMAM